MGFKKPPFGKKNARNPLNLVKTQRLKRLSFWNPLQPETPKKLAIQHIEMKFGKADYRNEIPANKPVSKADKLKAIWAKETDNKPTRKPNEATCETWHVLRIEWFKNLGR